MTRRKTLDLAAWEAAQVEQARAIVRAHEQDKRAIPAGVVVAAGTLIAVMAVWGLVALITRGQP